MKYFHKHCCVAIIYISALNLCLSWMKLPNKDICVIHLMILFIRLLEMEFFLLRYLLEMFRTQLTSMSCSYASWSPELPNTRIDDLDLGRLGKLYREHFSRKTSKSQGTFLNSSLCQGKVKRNCFLPTFSVLQCYVMKKQREGLLFAW